MPIPGTGRTDRELGQLDVPELLRNGLTTDGAGHAELFGGGTVAAAIVADRAGVQPRSLAFLADVVRSGGVGYAAALPEPLPGADRTALAREWLSAAADARADGEFARWLDAVAVLLGLRQHSTPPPAH